MVFDDEFNLWCSVYYLSVQKYVRDHVPCDHGSFTWIFGYIPSEGRNQVSERNDKVFFRDHSFGDSDSFDI